MGNPQTNTWNYPFVDDQEVFTLKALHHNTVCMSFFF